MVEKRRFVGKQVQNAMHVTANDQFWFATAADKILFHAQMSGARLPLPDLLAVTQPHRFAPDAPVLTPPSAVADLLRTGDLYPLFAKPVGGKYSLCVISADAYDPDTDEAILRGGERRPVEAFSGDGLPNPAPPQPGGAAGGHVRSTPLVGSAAGAHDPGRGR